MGNQPYVDTLLSIDWFNIIVLTFSYLHVGIYSEVENGLI